MNQSLLICDLGRMAYEPALEIQYQLLARRQEDLIGDVLLLVEHPPVLTLGTRGDSANIFLPQAELAAAGVQVHSVNRGGDVTYHGPGQVVGYPIMKIEQFPGSIRGFITSIEMALINLLRVEFGITATQRHDKYTGVWVGDEKIVAIGVAVKKWVTMHGFAFNVNTNLRHFDWINPCGLSMGVTSVEALTGQPVDFAQVTWLVGRYFAEAFGRTPVDCQLSELISPEVT
jgi:lipoyl(octanoyl) transferase